jgi:hypothetical protein
MIQITMMRIAMKATTPPTMPMIRVSSLFSVDDPAAGAALLVNPMLGLVLEEGLSLLGDTDQIMSGSVVTAADGEGLLEVAVDG